MGRAEDLFRRLSEQGEAAIDQMIHDRQSEELFFDFKRSADGGAGVRLHPADRENLAKAVSGFGNSEGGVILWGVDCRNLPEPGDVAQAKLPIQNPRRFLSWLEGAVSGCTVPPHSGVRHAAIELPDEQTGFVATLIPRSYLAPHQSVLGRPFHYIRAGSDFLPAPHGLLAGLFGRRPEAFLFHQWTIPPVTVTDTGAQFSIGFMLAIRGPGIARNLYVTVVTTRPSSQSEVGYETPDHTNWTSSVAFGEVLSLVSVDAFKLTPGALIQPVNLHFRLVPPFDHNLFYRITFGYEASPVREVSARVTPETLQNALEIFRVDPGAPDASKTFIRTVLALPDPTENPGLDFYSG